MGDGVISSTLRMEPAAVGVAVAEEAPVMIVVSPGEESLTEAEAGWAVLVSVVVPADLVPMAAVREEGEKFMAKVVLGGIGGYWVLCVLC